MPRPQAELETETAIQGGMRSWWPSAVGGCEVGEVNVGCLCCCLDGRSLLTEKLVSVGGGGSCSRGRRVFKAEARVMGYKRSCGGSCDATALSSSVCR